MRWLLLLALALPGCAGSRVLELETENAKLKAQVDGWKNFYRREQAVQADFMSRVSRELPRLVHNGIRAVNIPKVIENVIEPKDASLKGRLSIRRGMALVAEREAKNANSNKKTK